MPRAPALVSRRCGSLVTYVARRSRSPRLRAWPSVKEPVAEGKEVKEAREEVVVEAPEVRDFTKEVKVEVETAAEELSEASEASGAASEASAESSNSERPFGALRDWCRAARQRAESRGAPGAACCLGCCCSRCVGVPLAFQRVKTMKTVKNEEGEEAAEEATESGSETSESSSETSSEVDLEELSKRCAWTTLDRRLWPLLSFNRVAKSLFVEDLKAETSAQDVQQALEIRFAALPDFRARYLETGQTRSLESSYST